MPPEDRPIYPRRRPAAPFSGGERETLTGFLDFQRATVVNKVAELTTRQALTPLLRSSPALTLAGIVKHLTAVERWWFALVLAGEDLPVLWNDDDRDFEFRLSVQETLGAVVARYDEECERSRAIVARMRLNDMAARPGADRSVRWVLVHMIEETARHLGHMDLLRESIDGTKGE